VLRTALKPRWLALLAVALLAATGMAFLGQWQLTRAREHSEARTIEVAVSRPAVELTSLLKPRQSFTNLDADRPVTTGGTWDVTRQLLIADRYLLGKGGWWVLTPLVLPDGSAVAVVRGWSGTTTGPGVATATTGQVRIAGVLRPSEPPVDRAPGVGSGLPDGQLDGVDLTQLVQRWPYKLITGYVVMTTQDPPATAGLTPVPATAPSNKAVAWQNMSYALQWFIFAAFGLFLWYRLVRDVHLGTLPRPPSNQSQSPPTSEPQPQPQPQPVSDRGAPS
jgi:cytochrome oxidase assembly protein ShyY1